MTGASAEGWRYRLEVSAVTIEMAMATTAIIMAIVAMVLALLAISLAWAAWALALRDSAKLSSEISDLRISLAAARFASKRESQSQA